MATGTSSRHDDHKSPFVRAVEEYVQLKSKKGKTRTFVQGLQQQLQNGELPDENAVQQAMMQIEQQSSNSRATTNIRRILKPVVRVLSDYAGVVDTLSQADPMPTALIWGCMKAAIQCSSRFLDLYDKIKGQLNDLQDYLGILTEYDELFGESETMQRLLQNSYIDVLRFWRRVEKECQRCISNRMARAVASFSTSKIDDILASLEKTSKRMELLAQAVKARVDKGERENAAEERRLAGLAREDQATMLQIQQEMLRMRTTERKIQRKRDLSDWLLRETSRVNESNYRHQEQNIRARSPGTCAWLENNATFTEWINGTSSSSVLWIKAAPGVGKSVLCAYAIEMVQGIKADSCTTCFHYYTFDEEFSELQVLRSLAEQLANALWSQVEDINDEIHAITLKSTASTRAEDVKIVIRKILEDMSSRNLTTYVFLDGLDEECINEHRWSRVEYVVDYFTDLAKTAALPVRIWCGSQPHTVIGTKLQNYPSIEVTSDCNNTDIENYLSSRLPALESLELDQGSKTVILKELGKEAKGCFLWASLMVHSLSNAMSEEAVHDMLHEGLPKDYEKYYMKRLGNIDPSNARFVSVLLACIVHSKRPLRIEELCEATVTIDTEDGHDISSARRLFKGRVVSLCQPLVQVQETPTSTGVVSTCTLTHATVRTFLIKNADILREQAGHHVFSLTHQVMAGICLKYLSQARYQKLLERSGDTFVDMSGDDYSKYHLLSYAAKYWDKHLDEISYSERLYERVVRFITSPQYFTCLQVQSLLVEGQFQFWFNSDAEWQGPHFKRVYPEWLADNSSNEDFRNSYRLFFNDWGYVLNDKTSLKGPFPGEIDRCLFNSLGMQNFLSVGPSRFQSFVLEDSSHADSDYTPPRYFDAINEEGSVMVVLQIDDLDDSFNLEFKCQHWDITRPKPRLQSTQVLKTNGPVHWSLYDYPPSRKEASGRPPPIAFSQDLSFLRIGSRIYRRDRDGAFQPIPETNFDGVYVENIVSNNTIVAITTGKPISNDDEVEGIERGMHEYDKILSLLEKVILVSQTTTSAPTQESTEGTGSAESSASSASSVSEQLIEDNEKLADLIQHDRTHQIEEDEALFMSEDESSENSAEESWSDASSEMSEEMTDDGQWNDWANERHTLEDLEEEAAEQSSASGTDEDVDFDSAKGDEDLRSVANSTIHSETSEIWSRVHKEGKVAVSGWYMHAGQSSEEVSSESSEESNADSLESGYSPSNHSNSGSEDDSDAEDDYAKQLDALIFGQSGPDGEEKQRTRIQIFDTSRPSRMPLFHFTKFTSARLFDSPPAFHPSKSLLVWPMGDSEVLFADYQANKYFIRKLTRSTSHSCHVFIKARFSGSGEYVHFAALEASTKEKGQGKAGTLELTLQVSTHRLSANKVTRSPPRLMHRSAIPLGSVSTLNVSRSPHTLHWTEKYLYLTTRATTLDVKRIPLFRQSEGGENSVCYIQETIFLPRTVSSRTLTFIPPPSNSPEAARTHAKKDAAPFATVVIGSHSTMPSQRLLVPKSQVAPPMVVYLHSQKDLGGWVCKEALSKTEKERQRNSGGRLQGRFESFDLKDDCDILPFLY